MKKLLAVTGLLTFTIAIAGCGGPDSLVEDQIDHMNDLADAIENDAPESEIEEITERMEKTAKKLEDMDLSKEEEERLREKYEDEVKEASARLMKAMMAKAGREFGKQFPVMPRFGS